MNVITLTVQSLETTIQLFKNLAVFDFAYEQGHMAFVFLCLAHFISRKGPSMLQTVFSGFQG